ncbi:Uncharacterised protein [BD1-7 clade bacterium]|nr:Uncharacterised protein [BD1-7 clade bacterium]
MLNLQSTIGRNPDILFSDVDQEIILMNLESGSYFTLNAVGSEIWNLLESDMSIDALVNELITRFEISVEDCQKSVMTYMQKLIDVAAVSIH